MNRINTGRVIVGGIVSGVLIFLIMGLVHGRVLNGDWMVWKATFGPLIHAPSQSTSMTLWFIQSLVFGITGVWIYAGIRPRYGAGAATAIKAGFILWLAGYLTSTLNSLAMGVMPDRVIKVGGMAEFVAALVGTFIGAAIYKE
jgi:hypothetical protein